jgi:predicted DNA-binding transcriptional regulator YafY
MAQFDRIYQYKSIFSRKAFVPKLELLNKLEISEATFKRDLDKMRDVYNYEIVYDRYENAYRLNNTDGTYELPGLMFTHKELLALLTIHNMITELEPGLLGPKLQPLQDRLADLLASEGVDASALTQRVRAVHAGKRRLELKSFQVLAEATLERKQLHVSHYNRGRNETTVRDISPQQLVHYRDNWYVDAWCHKRERLQSFSVDAITHCEKLDKPAKEINQKAIQEQMQSGYGIFGGEARYWAKLKFTPERARWVQAEEWHPDQKSTLHPDGSYTLEVPYSDARELLGDVLRFGADVEVLAPKSLRASAMEAFSKALDQYKS